VSFVEHEGFVRFIAFELCDVDETAIAKVGAYSFAMLMSVRVLFGAGWSKVRYP